MLSPVWCKKRKFYILKQVKNTKLEIFFYSYILKYNSSNYIEYGLHADPVLPGVAGGNGSVISVSVFR